MTKTLLIFDGGCPFCKYYAELSELKRGIPGLEIKDARTKDDIIWALQKKGFKLKNGAIIIHEEKIIQGAEAVHWVSKRIKSSNYLINIINDVMKSKKRAHAIYPLLQLMRKIALKFKGLSYDNF